MKKISKKGGKNMINTNYKQIETKYKDLIEIAKNYMQQINDFEHNISHMNDVVLYTKKLLEVLTIDVNYEVCLISAYWHDVGRCKVNIGHESLSANMLKKEMTKLNYSSELITACCEAIKTHKWDMMPTTIEGLILKDADKLAWLGEQRWQECLSHNYHLDEIIKLLPNLRNEILYFTESKNIYDEEIVNLLKVLYNNLYK